MGVNSSPGDMKDELTFREPGHEQLRAPVMSKFREHMFSIKGQTVNILGFMVRVGTTNLLHCSKDDM